MKKMMKVLALTLIAMLLLSTAALADSIDFEAANTNDTYVEYQEPSYVEDYTDYNDYTSNGTDGVVSFGAVAPVAPMGETAAPAITPEVVPAIQAEGAPAVDYSDLNAFQSGLGLTENKENIEIPDAPVPLSSGLTNLFVEIYADNTAPNYGDNVTLKSFVSYQGGSPLVYQWQINRGFGWENILDANGADYTFNYNESVSNCSFRLFVDTIAA